MSVLRNHSSFRLAALTLFLVLAGSASRVRPVAMNVEFPALLLANTQILTMVWPPGGPRRQRRTMAPGSPGGTSKAAHR